MTSTPTPVRDRPLLNKVPEVTIWFWIVKILCTTVGESFADWINFQLGVGLEATSAIFTVVLLAVLIGQLRLRHYVPSVYWLTVVVLSITGTLYTDILTDDLGVPLALSTAVFAVVLAAVFGVWYARERTLSIHSIVTFRRETFYWLAVLVTFALGTAAGDWTLELTGWGPGVSVLLPAGLIGAVVLGWRLGANPVLAFWLAYILTRPLGANLGDWLGTGLGTALTSFIFLAAIVATVVYLSATRVDVIERVSTRPETPVRPGRQRAMLAYYSAVALATAGLLGWAATQPHSAASAEEPGATTARNAPAHPVEHFPTAEVNKFRTITEDTLAKLNAGDQRRAALRITDLEKAWDDDQSTLERLDPAAWSYLDGRIDAVLTAMRTRNPNQATEQQALTTLLNALA